MIFTIWFSNVLYLLNKLLFSVCTKLLKAELLKLITYIMEVVMVNRKLHLYVRRHFVIGGR